MQGIRVKFIEGIKRTATIESFRFAAAGGIDFEAGQFMQLIFNEADPSDKILNKYLSFSCAPGKDYIEATKRLSESAFSKRLKALKPGEEVFIKGPFGSCVFRSDYRKIAFLIGGIGITPVISIIEQIATAGIPTDTVLFYSNRSEEEIAFKQELDSWAEANSNIRVIYTVTDCPPRQKRCIYGRIDEKLLSEKLGDIFERVVFIFGPPKMVEAMQGLCLNLGCPKENIKTESFIGY
ncbi:MAG: FAD-dependent oxidoreductase [Candidatus Omnitrophota bacterium]